MGEMHVMKKGDKMKGRCSSVLSARQGVSGHGVTMLSCPLSIVSIVGTVLLRWSPSGGRHGHAKFLNMDS